MNYEANDIGPSWELIKQDVPDHRKRFKAANDGLTDLEAKYIAKMRDPYIGLDELRAKLTSWPAMFSKRYEVARALALGWWYQLTVKEQRDIVDGTVTVFICVAVIAVFGWLSSH